MATTASSTTSNESSSLLLHRHPITELPTHHHGTHNSSSSSNNDDDAMEDGLTVVSTTTTAAATPLHRTLSRKLSDQWENYVRTVEEKPLVTKAITATILMGLADLFAQGIEHIRGVNEEGGVDAPRVVRFAAFGLLGAPWSHYYYHWLDSCIPPSPEPWTRTTFLKVFIDQFVQAPVLLAFMIFALGVMKGGGWTGARHDLVDNFVDTLIANWKLWIPASIINLAFVQPSLRVLYVNIVFVFWTVILSLMLNKSSGSTSSS